MLTYRPVVEISTPASVRGGSGRDNALGFRICRMVLDAGEGKEISQAEFTAIKGARDVVPRLEEAERLIDMTIERARQEEGEKSWV